MTATPQRSSTNSIPFNPERGVDHIRRRREFTIDFPLPPSITFRYTLARAVVVVEGATLGLFVTELSTMLIIGLVLSVFGIGFFCWVLFILAVYALPFVAGLTAGLAAYHSGAGVAGAIIVAIRHGAITAVPRGDRAALYGAGGDRRLQRHARFRPDGHSVRGLACDLRGHRRNRCRRHGLGTDGAVHPTGRGAAH